MNQRRGADARNAHGVQIGDHNVQVNDAQHVTFLAGAAVEWPVTVGSAASVAAAWQPRTTAWELVDAAWSHGDTVLVSQLITGDGGVGKSQFAAGVYAGAALDLKVWVDARERASIVDTYAAAATAVGAPLPTTTDIETRAKAFLNWLSGTARSWLVVLDDLNVDPADTAGLWPRGKGRVLVTTRRRDAGYAAHGRTRVELGVFTGEESTAYLQRRLVDDGGRAAAVLDQAASLAEDLHHLPVALAQAAAVILDRGENCASYRARFADETRDLAEIFPDSARDEYQHTVAATWQLALAQATRHSALAYHAAMIAAVLDAAAAPEPLWHHALHALDRGNTAGKAMAEETRTALRALHRFSIIDHDPDRDWAQVRIHALAARAIRSTPPPLDLASIAPRDVTVAAATALAEIWSTAPHHAETQFVLRANATVLEDRLLQSDPDPGTLTAFAQVSQWHGWSLRATGAHSQSIRHGLHAQAALHAHLGPDHPDTLTARGNLASSYRMAGRAGDAIPLEKAVLAASERVLGADHPDTLKARGNLAGSYRMAGRASEAIPLQAAVLADSELLLGADHPDTLRARGNLASYYSAAGRTEDAIPLEEAVLAASEQLLGADHPDTLRARGNLATSYWAVGRADDAIPLEEAVLTDRERLLGRDNPDTITARGNLASSYWAVGRTDDAIALEEAVLTDRERLLGYDHPDTNTARENLAVSYRETGRAAEAIALEGLSREPDDPARTE